MNPAALLPMRPVTCDIVHDSQCFGLRLLDDDGAKKAGELMPEQH
jgi:hypothetical protein